jgi:hypothetical protein
LYRYASALPAGGPSTHPDLRQDAAIDQSGTKKEEED